jgi:outer membrane protein
MFRLGLLFLASVAIACAQAKVAVVNIQTAILDTSEIKKAQAEMEGKYKPRQAQLARLQSELSDLQSKLEGGKLTGQAAADAQLTGQRKQRDAQRLADDLQADVDRDRNDILSRSGQRMNEVVKKIAEERGLDVVIDTSNTLYFKPALDITKDATAAYEKAYPAAK